MVFLFFSYCFFAMCTANDETSASVYSTRVTRNKTHSKILFFLNMIESSVVRTCMGETRIYVMRVQA